MKKILISLAAFAALATACQVEDINENITPEGEKYVIEAAIASTKTVYESTPTVHIKAMNSNGLMETLSFARMFPIQRKLKR